MNNLLENREQEPKTDTSFANLPLALTVSQAAEVLQLGKSLVYALVRCGRLRSLRVGRKIRIPRDALREFLDTTT